MGIDPATLPDRVKRLMAEPERKELKLELTSERHARLERTLEREQQNIKANWLSLREAAGVLVYDWSRTDRKTTNRKGMPDFRIYAQGRALLAEMKVGAGKLSADQEAMIAKFTRSGTRVLLWYSAAEAIEATRNWLSQITYGKDNQR